MQRRQGCLPISGFLAMLALLAGVILITLVKGGLTVASPGALSSQAVRGQTLQGTTSHADLENQCSRCHAPFWSAETMAERCLVCHTDVQDQISGSSGLHGQIKEPRACKSCHTEHRGRSASLTLASLDSFPHEVTTVGFTLVRHQKDYDGVALQCSDCHGDSLVGAFDQQRCDNCHRLADAGFMQQHVADFGGDCLQCHDGSGELGRFDHDQTNFPLTGKHQKVECRKCHSGGVFAGLDTACVACHRQNDAHDGAYGDQCQQCHNTRDWEDVTLKDHRFSLNHGRRSPSECTVCHENLQNFKEYTCYGCHEHTVSRIRSKHLKEGINNFENCVECHPTGREKEGGREGGDD